MGHKENMNSLWYSYGITEDEFQSMMNRQGGCCAICHVDFGKLSQRASVDHCHSSGRVRGLLCSVCNTKLEGLEYFMDLGILTAAEDYLWDV